jgi:putative transposase
MPNRRHLVLWREHGGELAAFMQKLTMTHTRNWQEHRRRAGYGHIYQGRYKSFPIQTTSIITRSHATWNATRSAC